MLGENHDVSLCHAYLLPKLDKSVALFHFSIHFKKAWNIFQPVIQNDFCLVAKHPRMLQKIRLGRISKSHCPGCGHVCGIGFDKGHDVIDAVSLNCIYLEDLHALISQHRTKENATGGRLVMWVDTESGTSFFWGYRIDGFVKIREKTVDLKASIAGLVGVPTFHSRKAGLVRIIFP